MENNRFTASPFPAAHRAPKPKPFSSLSSTFFSSLSSSRFSWSPLSAIPLPPALCAATQQASSPSPSSSPSSSEVEPATSARTSALFSSRVSQQLGVDAAAACLASFGVSPFVTVIDRSIVQGAAGRRRLWDAIGSGLRDLAVRPLHVLSGRDFRIVFGVYAGTYFVANSAATLGRELLLPEATAELFKFLSTTAANMYLCIRKDIIFAQLFGAANASPSASSPSPCHGVAGRGASAVGAVENAVKATSRKFPMVSTLLFVSRDALTIAASFNAPAYLAAWLTRRAAADDLRRRRGSSESAAIGSDLEADMQMTREERREAAHADGRIPTMPQAHRDWMGSDRDDPVAAGGGESVGAALEEKRVWHRFVHRLAAEKSFADSTAQLICPVLVQFLSTPLHLLSLDIYNKPGQSGMQRAKFVVGAYAGTVAARASRILPAFGIGGILNAKTKEALRQYTHEETQ
ncbi:hypothetical protein TGPRC2_216660 [Toxoplasma gondii TgCatPRC2]|uniref:Mitochondrial carrier superfamily protein n=12 Tax=Toxoplasma gondii TaxID=5811 RepID=B6KT43_TOXGV|nr:hypothetical protein TGME49_216660 [Toxoplasma gondii ME49]EPR58675.1 hypothetical protein TGGT1_216660 [Toxoplasma gondii GT1]ESS28684.1 hypothetical protein TGVEG_216660 [Toxoplasma gondii VEG]KAF4639821.1 hypothetical protein TGRH88_055930 [Toxoplasma gondii]KFG32457.1 hypothetical protein TGDOM2_216660 [Toxoplasma gondii GAB2-2007-GAL-DOM2]KFG41132.1 hypothetical protein TGFOU_216660 [Toxoplasma gondii FOU]KFH10896.1 hypothetical protein TGMAS_216660 [Toxoplasma gondii MAS]KYF38789.1 |eukprot:XP_002370974.1 hypothetical protein TGME49_216660 [Toxoplasma gondii ME49]